MKTMQTFDDVVEAHGSTVLRMCASLLGPGADAEDAWSETFLAALHSYPFAADVNVQAWLVRVARNKAVDILRAQRRVDVVASDELRMLGEAHFVDEEIDDALWAHVAALTDRQRFVIAHRFIAQWTYPEIAEKLRCTPAAARRTGADALALLRRRYPREEEPR